MKATLEIPDELYRRVKSRSALEGRPLRAVAIELFEHWLENKPAAPSTKPTLREGRPVTRFDNASWVKIARRHIKPGVSHDMADIRESIGRGWAAEAAGKFGPKARAGRK